MLAGDSEKETNHLTRIFSKWPRVQYFCESMDIKLTNQDFKDYILVSLACMYESENLRQQLVNDFGSLLAAYVPGG